MAEEAPPTSSTIYSDEWHNDHHIRVNSSSHLLRLRWRAWRPIEAIRVLDEDNSTVKRPYGHHAHPVAGEQLTQPAISSIDVRLAPFGLWLESWAMEHERHGEWDDEDVMEDFGTRMVAPSRDEEEWCLVESYAEENGLDVDADDLVVPACRRMRCCGLDRPMNPENAPCVRLTGTGEGGVITIGDWVACVHAMLEQYHQELLQARGMWHTVGGESDVRSDEIVYVDQTASVRYIKLQGERDTDISRWEG